MKVLLLYALILKHKRPSLLYSLRTSLNCVRWKSFSIQDEKDLSKEMSQN